MSPGQTSIIVQEADSETGASRGLRLDIVFEGARDVTPTGHDRLPGIHNYLRGRDSSAWITHVPLFARVEYRDLRPGVSAYFYESESGALEYDVVFDPDASVESFVVRCEGTDGLELSPEGALLISTELGTVRQHIPAAWEETASGERRDIRCSYEILDGQRYRFRVEGRDPSRRLVVDPVFSFSLFRSLQWSTYLGGSSEDRAYDVAVADFGAAAGDVFIVGTTDSSDFPVTSGSFQTTKSGFKDVFVTRLNSTGSALKYSTFFGGSCDDEGRAIDLAIGPNPDNENALEPVLATFTGFTNTVSTCIGFPFSTNPYDVATKCNFVPPPFTNQTDAFVAQLDALGSTLIYSSYLGGDGADEGHDIVVDRSVSPSSPTQVFLTGWTGPIDAAACAPVTVFPIAGTVFDPSFNGQKDVFCAHMSLGNTGTTDLLNSTYLGGDDEEEGRSIALHSSGDVIVAGLTQSSASTFPVSGTAFQQVLQGSQDAFVFRFTGGTNPLAIRAFCTYLGGSDTEAANAVVVNEDAFGGQVTLAGSTSSTDFPLGISPFQGTYGGGLNDGFVSRLSASGATLAWSIYVGGSNDDVVWGMTGVPGKTSVDICGHTASANFPTTTGAYDTLYNGGTFDAFVARVRNDGGALNCSTFLGGAKQDVPRGIASDGTYEVVVVGWTEFVPELVVPHFPTTLGAFSRTHSGPSGGMDAFASKFRVANIIGL